MNESSTLPVNDVLQGNPENLILHGLMPESNGNGVLSPFAELEEKVKIIVGLQPEISTFSANLMINSRSGFYAHSGLIITEGQVVSATQEDNATKPNSISSRTYFEKGDPTSDLHEIMGGIGRRRGISSHNEINIASPGVGGFYVLPKIDNYSGVSRNSYSDEEVNNAAVALNFPVYLITNGGLILAKFQDGRFVATDSPILKSNEIPKIEISEESIQNMRQEVMERSPFDINKVGLPDSLRCMNVAKGMMLQANLIARNPEKIKTFNGFAISNIYSRSVIKIFKNDSGRLTQSDSRYAAKGSLIPEVSQINPRSPLRDIDVYPSTLGVHKEISQDNYIDIILSQISEWSTRQEIQESLIAHAFGVYLAADKTGQTEFATSILNRLSEAGFGDKLERMAAMWQGRVGEDGSFRLKPEDLEKFHND